MMTSEEIAQAQVEKRRYLLSFLLMVLSRGLGVLTENTSDGLQFLASVASPGTMIFGLVMTWRFARSIKVGIPMAVVNTIAASIFFIIPLVVLIRIYSKRTGIRLSFLAGDKPPEEQAGA